VLDEVTGAHPAWPGAGLIDPSQMGMAGHSAGGAAAIAAMLADPASARASTWTAPLPPRSRIRVWHGRFCS
jgi:acetyl esterase/lipase